MKTLIFTFIFLLHFLIPIKSNNNTLPIINTKFDTDKNQRLGKLFEDKGQIIKVISDNELIHVKVKVFKKELNEQTQKSFKTYDTQRYGYTIIGISESKFNNQLTSTWLYGFWVKVNGVQITRPLYPTGKDIMVYTTPTEIYYFETHEDSVFVKVGWLESIYEPKIIK